MAQYDGSIRIGTEIITKQAEKELKSLESSISKNAEKIASLRSKMDALKDVKLPTSEYKKLQRELDSTIAKYTELDDRVNDFKKIGMDVKSDAFRKAQDEAQELYMRIEDIRGAMFDLEESGKAFTLGNDTEKYAQMSVQLQQLNQQMETDTQRQSELQSALAAEEERLAQIRKNAVVSEQMIVEAVERRKQLLQEIADLEAAGVTHGYQDYDSRIQELAEIELKLKDYSSRTKEMVASYKQFGQSMRQLASRAVGLLSSMGDAIKRVDSGFKMLGERVRNTFSRINRSAQKTGGIFTTMASRFKGLALSLLIFNQISRAFNTMTRAIRDGFKNLYEDHEKFKNSVDNLNASVLTLKNAFAAAFRPLVDVAIPYIQMAADKMAELLNMVGQFTAAITGQKTYTKAIKQTADAFKEAEKAASGYLSPLDEINKYSDGTSKDEDANQFGTMFEELPVEQKFIGMAEKVKDVLKDLFAPIKEAWNSDGEFVIDSWKYGLGEIKKLLADIGRDFLTVWQQEATITIFQDILHIIGDIGLIAGNLASKFREAWNENEVGMHILENIRDILGIIVEHIKNAADKTVEWSEKIDFYPLLDAFNRLLESLEPVVDSISRILEDFYTKVMLPLGTWVLEKGLPELLQVFIDFNNKVDWESLRTNLAEFWEHLEPFAETVGEGLIIFIERISDALANFLNSQEFKDFLVMVENWMDSVTPEDVADGFQKIATAILVLKVASAAFTGISSAFTTFSGVASILKGVLSPLAPLISGIGSALGGLIVPIGIVVGVLAALAAGFIYAYNTSEEFRQKVSDLKDKFIEFWEESLKPMLEEWGEKFRELWEEHLKPCIDSLMELLKTLWEDVLVPIAGWIVDTLLPILLPIIDEVFNTSMDLIGELLDEIKDLADIISNVIGLVADLLRGDWSSAWEHAGNIVETVWNGITRIIQGAVEKITGWIEGLLSLFDKANSKGASVGSSGESSQSNSTRSFSMRSMSMPYSAYPAIEKLNNMPIPGYATGQVIPRTMQKHLAWLGDNNRETEVVSPLSTIEQAVINAMGKINTSGITGGRELTIKVPIYLDGKLIYEAVINQGMIEQMSSGNNGFLLGTV